LIERDRFPVPPGRPGRAAGDGRRWDTNPPRGDSYPSAARPRRRMGVRLSGRFSLLLRATISVLLIGFLLSRVDLPAVGRTFRDANLGLLVLDFFLYLGAITLGAFKWQILCRAQAIRVPFWKLLDYSFVGLFFGNFLPSNVGGDVVRAFDLSRSSGRAEAASISVLVDRIIGLLVFVGAAAFASLVALVAIRDHPEITGIAFASSGIFLGILVVFGALLSRRVSRSIGFLFRRFPQLAPLDATARRIYAALQVFRHARGALLWAALISLGIQFLTALVNYLIAVALGVPIPFVYVFLFNPLVAFILLIPISINGIGLKEAVYVFFYTTIAGLATAEQSLSLSIGLHVMIVLSGLIGGFFWLPRRRDKPVADAAGAV
jgi:uncharacterized protein (TIRG00374 family)